MNISHHFKTWIGIMRRHGRLLLTPVLAVAALVFLGFTAPYLSSWGWDATQSRVHSLADGSRRTLAELSETVDVYFYYSRKLDAQIPQFGLYATQVESLLRQYRDLSGGKIRLHVVDPEPYAESEDQAMQNGLSAIPLYGGTEQAYFGLYAQSGLGKRAVIPQFDPARQNLLEYDLTRLFYAMAHPQKPKIGVISPLPMDGDFFSPLAAGDGAPAPWIFWLQLSQSYDLQKLAPSISAIDDDIDALLIVHPQNLKPSAIYAVDQFMMRKPRAVVLVDPHSEAMAARQTANPNGVPSSSDMEPLLRVWGVSFDPKMVVGDLKSAQRVVVDDVAGKKPQSVDYIAWLRLNQDRINRDDPVTSNLRRLNFASAGSIVKNPAVDTEFVPLLTSSGESMLLAAEKIRYMPDPKLLLDEFRSSQQNYVLAARLRGSIKSFYGNSRPDGLIPTAVSLPPHQNQSTAPANIIVIADSDFIEDRFWVRVRETVQSGVVQTNADNADFVMNAIDDVVGTQYFASIRSRQNSDRPLTVMHDIRQAAESQFRAKEKALKQKLDAAESKLGELRKTASPDQQKEWTQTISELERSIWETRSELRRVQRDLNRDIEGLQNAIRFWLIVIWPLLAAAIMIGGWRIWLRLTQYSKRQ